MQKRWVIKKHDHKAAAELAEKIGTSPLVAALLIDRGHGTPETAASFLRPHNEKLNSPWLLKGLPEAVERITKALENGETILVWGDYDVDGTTGTTLLRRVFSILGGKSEFHIPNRFTEGYGVNIPALREAKERGVGLVITVDCGIRSFEPIEWAAANGLDVIVTDHHLSDEVRGNPPALAVIDPNQPGCTYPDKNLAGVGVAFKLAEALLEKFGYSHLIPSFLKIAAIGTVADIVRLTGENRAIVARGLADLKTTRNLGLRALIEVADCGDEMTSTHIGFRIAPRINAAGRMDIARYVVELFEAEDSFEAQRIARLLDSRNKERQAVQADITERALLEATEIGATNFVVVSGEGWHRGVIGLAASKIVERLHRPAIVLSEENGVAHGSARSIPGFHLLDAFDSCSELFIQYGGHAAAAGMQIRSENIPLLRERLNGYVDTVPFDPQPALLIDARVSSATLSHQLVEQISDLEPFGAGNPKPIFITSDLTISDEPRVMKEKHLKLWLVDGAGKKFEAVWWDGVTRSKGQTLGIGDRIEVAYTAETNHWQGRIRLQLVIEDIRADNSLSG